MVKCIDCGYLAARHHETRLLEEVEEIYRNTGTSPNTTVGYKHDIGIPIYEEPICFMRFCDLKAEYRMTKDLLSILRKDRECDSTDWKQGFTPKEHREMMDREKMLKWQAEREESDRKWRSAQEWKLVIVAGIFTLIGGVIVALVIKIL